jgi:integrase
MDSCPGLQHFAASGGRSNGGNGGLGIKAMAIYKLSETRINKLIRQGKKGKYGDGGNLWLEVFDVDVASFFLRWKDRITKKDRSLSYGPWHITDLEEAREKARADRRLLRDGKDPKAERDQRILDDQIARGLARTVRQVIDEYDRDIVSHNARNTQIGSRRQLARINRLIGDMPIAKVNKQIIIDDVLKKDDLWVKKNPTAVATQGELIAIFELAIHKGYVPTGYNPALWAHLKRALPKRNRVHKTKHHPGVPYKKMGEFMQELRDYHYRGFLQCYQGRPPNALCLELIALTGCRPGEARLALWKEFNFDEMVWTVPIEHLKMGHTYDDDEGLRRPITKAMLAVLEQAKQIAYPKDSSKWMDGHKRGPIFPRARHTPDCSSDALVFPNSVNEPYGEALLARFMRDHLSKWNPAVPHGFRTSLKDWWKANGFHMDWWEIQVDHRGDTLKKTYGKDDLLEQRRGKMELWGEYCSQPAPEPKVGRVLKLSDKRRTA